jgi:hypothetical protein
VLHHSEEVVREERELGYTLVVIVGCCRPVVSTANVRLWLQVQFNILDADVRNLWTGRGAQISDHNGKSIGAANWQHFWTLSLA